MNGDFRLIDLMDVDSRGAPITYTLTNSSDVLSILKEYRKKQRRGLTIETAIGELNLGVGGGRYGFVEFVPRSKANGVVRSVGKLSPKDSTEHIIYNVGGTGTEIPKYTLISFKELLRCVEEFLVHGTLPNDIEWETV